ncbi:tyrosine-type recombinase/integrase [Pseudonocardia sp.]|uniref:tyrosine-type recombinase/integrase n=1 Tax=Pseudonocardia sp. TaxID=60912 RepID=UPI0031FD320F
MAYAEKRGKSWRGRYRRPDGSYASTSGFTTKRAALQAASDEESSIRHNTWIDRRVAEMLFTDFANQWHSAVTPRLSPSTAAKYRRYLDVQLIPKWGDWPMIGIFNSHFEIEGWVTSLHNKHEESSVASYFGCFSTIMNAGVRARVIPANPCSGIRVTGGEWETEKYVATPAQALRAGMRLYENQLGLGGLMLCLLDFYTGGRWGELAGQMNHEYDQVNKAIGVFEPLKEVDGRLMKGGTDVTALDPFAPRQQSGRRKRRIKKGARTKSPAGERWVPLPPSIATMYELLLDGKAGALSFAFTSLQGDPWYRSNFRQRFWRPAWDGVDAARPSSPKHVPAILAGFTFHEGRHTHSSWLAEDGVPEIARRARLGHKMKGMARVYDHVTPEMERQVREALEARFLTSVLELTDPEREKLLTWVPTIRPAVERAQEEAMRIADGVAGVRSVSQITPIDRPARESSGGQGAS